MTEAQYTYTPEPWQPEFKSWGKIRRRYRDIVITEKINGTNAAVVILSVDPLQAETLDGRDDIKVIAKSSSVFSPTDAQEIIGTLEEHYVVYAQSRNKVIDPQHDNAGFARYVWDNAWELISVLGVGTHFGEWWGSGIQNSYGLAKGEKRFSLFNALKWTNEDLSRVPNLGVVPILYQGMNTDEAVKSAVEYLDVNGSVASPGFMDPEGVIIFHTADHGMEKVTLYNDEKPKGSKE